MANQILGEVSPTNFFFETHPVRIVLRDGEPWFVATDVCTALEYLNPSKAIADHVDEDDRSNETLDRSRMGKKAIIISESGLYALVFRSKKQEAKKFAKWVTSVVLPSIRKTGSYREGVQASSNAETQTSGKYTQAARIAPELMEILRSFNLTAETANSIAIEQLRIETGLHLLSAFKAAKAHQETPAENLRWIEAEATRIVSMIPDDAVAMTHSFLQNLIGITDNLPVKQ